jgi:hypothetical protein
VLCYATVASAVRVNVSSVEVVVVEKEQTRREAGATSTRKGAERGTSKALRTDQLKHVRESEGASGRECESLRERAKRQQQRQQPVDQTRDSPSTHCKHLPSLLPLLFSNLSGL